MVILYDLDGVLVDACDWHFKALNKALAHYKIKPISLNEHIEIYNGLPTKTKLLQLQSTRNFSLSLVNQISELKQKYTVEIIRKKCKIHFDKIQLHLALKKQGYILGCVTNSIKETAHMMLKLSGQFDCMSIVVTNEDVRKNKPCPDCYLFAMEKLLVKPSDCIIIEDSNKGIEAAKQTGAKVIAVKNATEVNIDLFKDIICI